MNLDLTRQKPDFRIPVDPSRVLELFAKRNLVPRRWHSDRVGPGGRELAIDLQVEGLTVELTDYIARCLRQLHYVDSVLTSEKVPAERHREKVWA